MLHILVLFPVVFSLSLHRIGETPWIISSKNATKTIYVTFVSYLSDPVLLEVKSYCSANNFLDTSFLTSYEINHLLELNLPIENKKAFTKSISIKGEWNKREKPYLPGLYDGSYNGRWEYLTKSDLLLRKFRDYAVSLNYFFDDDGLPVWQNMTLRPWMNAMKQYPRMNVTIEEEEITLSFHGQQKLKDWPLGYSSAGQINEYVYNGIQEWLEKRSAEIKVDPNHTVYFQELENLFYQQKMDKNFFTEDVISFFEELHPSVNLTDVFNFSSFKVVGCAEQRRHTRVSALAVAVKITVPQKLVYQPKGEKAIYRREKPSSSLYEVIQNFFGF